MRPSPRRTALSIALSWGISWGILGMAISYYATLRHFVDESGLIQAEPLGPLAEGALNAMVGTLLGLFVAFLISRLELRGHLGERPRHRLMFGGAVAGILSVALFAALRIIIGARLDPETLLWAGVWLTGLGADSGVAGIELVQRQRVVEPAGAEPHYQRR